MLGFCFHTPGLLVHGCNHIHKIKIAFNRCCRNNKTAKMLFILYFIPIMYKMFIPKMIHIYIIVSCVQFTTRTFHVYFAGSFYFGYTNKRLICIESILNNKMDRQYLMANACEFECVCVCVTCWRIKPGPATIKTNKIYFVLA